MGFLWFKKRDYDFEDKFKELHSGLKTSFSNIKKDFEHVISRVDHLHLKKDEHHDKLDKLDKRLREIETFFELMKEKEAEFVHKGALSKQAVQTGQTEGVQTAVQTPVFQTGFLAKFKSLTPTERNLVVNLLNHELKLSCEDLGVMMLKNKGTVRGLINNIKRKYSDLISEMIEENGKKRYFIEPDIKSELMKEYKHFQRAKKKGKKLTQVRDYIG